MLVPAIKPGEGMPAEIVNFNRNFMERVQKYEFSILYIVIGHIIRGEKNF